MDMTLLGTELDLENTVQTPVKAITNYTPTYEDTIRTVLLLHHDLVICVCFEVIRTSSILFPSVLCRFSGSVILFDLSFGYSANPKAMLLQFDHQWEIGEEIVCKYFDDARTHNLKLYRVGFLGMYCQR